MIVDAIATLAPVDLKAKPDSVTRLFNDIDQAGDWSRAKIEWAQWNIIPTGTAIGSFRPQDYATRPDLLVFLWHSAER